MPTPNRALDPVPFLPQTSEFSNMNSVIDQPLQGFDAKHPPQQTLIDACVHCGFCLSTCPSYRVLGTETDSPRGRIYLMNGVKQGETPLSSAVTQHFDSCLGCLACVTTCPSGVQYDQLIAATRPQVERHQTRSWPDQVLRTLIFNLFPYPQRLRSLLPLLWFYQRTHLPALFRATGLLRKVSPQLAAMESILPRVTSEAWRDPFPTVIPAQGSKRFRVGMILGCVQRLFFSPVNEATVRVLTANGCEVVIPKSQGCCAALPEHQGQEDQAQTLARRMIDSFAHTEVDYIVINAAGCGHTLKNYDRILQDDTAYQAKAQQFVQKVRDAQEFLMEEDKNEKRLIAPLSPLADREVAIVYQDACHLLHGQQISNQPRQLLRQIPGVSLREPLDAALCCGSAGVYNMLQPEVAEELGQQKVTNLLNTGADVIASPNPGCSLQITKHLRLKGQTILLLHPMELLDYSIRGIKIQL